MIEIILIVLVIFLLIIIVYFFEQNRLLNLKLEQLAFAKNSQSVKYGKMSEQFIPFSSQFPFNPNSFRFLGSPIDGVAFEEDKIVFCEFKTNTSQLSEKQKKIRKLVEDRKVEWLEFKTA